MAYLILHPQNMRTNTEIVLISCIVTKTLTNEGFSVMAAIIWILEGLPKVDGAVPFRILKSKLRWYRNSKKIVRTVIARFSKNLWLASGLNRGLKLTSPLRKWRIGLVSRCAVSGFLLSPRTLLVTQSSVSYIYHGPKQQVYQDFAVKLRIKRLTALTFIHPNKVKEALRGCWQSFR